MELSQQLDVFKPLVEDVAENQRFVHMTSNHCRPVQKCGVMFEYFAHELGRIGYLNVDDVSTVLIGIFAMFHHSTPDQKEEVLKSLMDDGPYRVVIATNALRKGTNARYARTVLNFGILEDAESYYQEIGPRVEIGSPSVASFFYKSIHLVRARDSMKAYARNKSLCRRVLLMAQFEVPEKIHPQHDCCEVCGIELQVQWM